MSLPSRTDRFLKQFPTALKAPPQFARRAEIVCHHRQIQSRPAPTANRAAPCTAQLHKSYPSKSTALHPNDTQRHSLARTLSVCRHHSLTTPSQSTTPSTDPSPTRSLITTGSYQDPLGSPLLAIARSGPGSQQAERQAQMRLTNQPRFTLPGQEHYDC